MGKRYFVHSRHDTVIKTSATTPDGFKVHGELPCAIIELVPLDERDPNTVTRREIMPTEADRKRIGELFHVGTFVEEGEWKVGEPT